MFIAQIQEGEAEKVKSHLERFLAESALRRQADDDLARHQEIIRLLWNHLSAVSDLDPDDIYGDEDFCSELIAKSIDILTRVEILCGGKAEETNDAN